MCTAMGLEYVALAASVVSAGVGAYSSIQQGKAAKDQADYQSQIQYNQAQLSRNAATDKENVHREKVQQMMGTQRAQLGAANVDLSSGSALSILEDTETIGEADAMRIRDYGDQQYSAGMSASEFSTMKGDTAYTQGLYNAGGSLLSGASSVFNSGVADSWYSTDSAAVNPYVTSSNPLGLTPGQGL